MEPLEIAGGLCWDHAPGHPVYVVDWQNGVTLMPDTYQVAKLGSHVDLRAQVRDATITSISWDTSHLTPVANLPSQFIAGDIQQIALQSDMTGLSTDRYDYTATVVDYRTTNTTTTLTGTITCSTRRPTPSDRAGRCWGWSA